VIRIGKSIYIYIYIVALRVIHKSKNVEKTIN
jgi:hypothetical protein